MVVVSEKKQESKEEIKDLDDEIIKKRFSEIAKVESKEIDELLIISNTIRELKRRILEQEKQKKETDRNFYYLLAIISMVVVSFLGVIFYARRSKLANQVNTPPASLLLRIAELLPKKHRQSLEQEVSDMRLEYYETLKEKKFLLAKFIVASYYIGLGWSVIMWISDKVKEVVGLLPKKN
jgi:hypothetical protein